MVNFTKEEIAKLRKHMAKVRVNKTTENTIESYLVEGAKKRGGTAIKIQLLTGWPDRLVLLPGGWLAWVELKRPKGGVFEPLQQRVHARLRRWGFRMRVINTKVLVDELFKEYDDDQMDK